MEPTSPNTNNQDHGAVENLDEIVVESGFENIQMAPMSPNPNDQSHKQEHELESGGENIEMAPMSPKPNHESQEQEQEENNHAKACNQEKLTRKISEPTIESDTSSSNGDNCATSTCPETLQEASENAESIGKNIFSVKKTMIFDQSESKPFS
jgi:hypothetical protein